MSLDDFPECTDSHEKTLHIFGVFRTLSWNSCGTTEKILSCDNNMAKWPLKSKICLMFVHQRKWLSNRQLCFCGWSLWTGNDFFQKYIQVPLKEAIITTLNSTESQIQGEVDQFLLISNTTTKAHLTWWKNMYAIVVLWQHVDKEKQLISFSSRLI